MAWALSLPILLRLQRRRCDMPISETIWEIEPHTRAKHEVLKRYLQAWFPIVGSWANGLNYIDGFAGPGEYVGGEAGSPVIAMETVINHRIPITSNIFFGFIELREDRARNLERVLAERFPNLPRNMTYQVFCASYEETMAGILEYIEDKGTRLSPTFAFLDPFGYSGMPLELTKRLLDFPSCEVLVTFMEGFVNRFAEIEDMRSEELDRLFACEDWRLIRKIENPDERRDFLLAVYQEQLERFCESNFVRSFEMINDFNQTVYFLTFATKNWKGMKVMKEAMWKVDPTGNFRYSDRTNPQQRFLFDFSDEAFWHPEALMIAALDFLGVTHSTPDWFALPYTTIGGFSVLGGIVAGCMGKVKLGFWISIIGLLISVLVAAAAFASRVGYEFERSWADSESERERLDKGWKAFLFYMLVGAFGV